MVIYLTGFECSSTDVSVCAAAEDTVFLGRPMSSGAWAVSSSIGGVFPFCRHGSFSSVSACSGWLCLLRVGWPSPMASCTTNSQRPSNDCPLRSDIIAPADKSSRHRLSTCSVWPLSIGMLEPRSLPQEHWRSACQPGSLQPIVGHRQAFLLVRKRCLDIWKPLRLGRQVTGQPRSQLLALREAFAMILKRRFMMG